MVAAGVAAALPADAVERPLIKLSKSKTSFKVTHGPLTHPDPLGAFMGVEECKTTTSCDTIPVELDASGWKPEDFIALKFKVSWEAEEAEGTNVPDVDMYIYDNTPPCPEPKTPEQCGHEDGPQEVSAGGATSAQPEEAGVDVLDRGKVKFYAIVKDFAGGAVPEYTFEVFVQSFITKPIPKFSRPPIKSLPPPSKTSTSTPAPTVDDGGPSGPAGPLGPIGPTFPTPGPSAGPTDPPIFTPGPDGDPTSFALSGVPANAEVEQGGASWWVVLMTFVIVGAVLGGTGFLLFRRVRTRSA